MSISALSQIQAAALLSVAPRTLRDWHDAPRNPDGTYSGPAIVAYYVAKMAGGGGEFDDQRQRLAAAQAEKVEHENAIRRGQLADIAVVERQWNDFTANCRARLLAIPSKLGPRLVNLADPAVINTAIRSEIRAALAELADYEPPAGDGTSRGDSKDGAAPGPAAGPDGKPVGGRRKAPQQRKQRGARAVAD